MAAHAAALAPEKTGKLSFSIAISPRRTRRVRKQRKDAPTFFEIAMGPASGLGTLYYATHDEFGTVDTPPQPFMRPAWDAGKAGLLDDVKDGLTVEIAKAAKRVAAKKARARK